MDQIPTLLLLALSIFGLTALIQIAFPVEVYEKVKSTNYSVITKGQFAYTVESLYQIKTRGLDADKKYWWHVIWFDSAVSLTVSVIITIGVAVLIAIAIIIITLIVIAMLLNN